MKRQMQGLLVVLVVVCVIGAIALLYQRWQRDQHDRGLFTPIKKADLKATEH